jgi:biotin transport system ATP-binding protein
MTVIRIEGLTYRFLDGTVGLDNVNLTIPQGQLVVLAGRNGSGKTTLLRHLNGLLRPQAGSVLLDGQSVYRDLRQARQLVGMVFQDADSQIVGETVREDVAFGPENLGLDQPSVERIVEKALNTVGLNHLADHRPHTLSGGEKRRLAIAGILAMEPRIVVFDEPFSNLDYPGVKQVLRQMIGLHQSGRTVIIATHDLEKIIAHADRLLILRSGCLVRDGSPKELINEVEEFGVRRPCASRWGQPVESWLA